MSIIQVWDFPMVDSKGSDDPTALIASLLRKVHEQSLDGPEPSPFWRQGTWRCEFHRHAGQERLKVFRGDRCVHEEVVQGGARAQARCNELRQVLMHDDRGGPGESGGTD